MPGALEVSDSRGKEEDACPTNAHPLHGFVIRLGDDDAETMPRGDKHEIRVAAVDEPRSIPWPQSAADQERRHCRHRTPRDAQPGDQQDDEEQANRQDHRRLRRHLWE